MDRVGSANWNKFRKIIRDAHDTFNQETIIWYRSLGGMDRWGEDNVTERFEIITLNGLFLFNYFRTWPITYTTETGELDRQSKVLLLNIDYLGENGWLDPYGKLNHDAAADRFEYRGELYKDMGNTELSQAASTPLLTAIVLKEEEKKTGLKFLRALGRQFDDSFDDSFK